MSEDEINRIETIVGYLRPLYNDLDIVKKKGSWHFMPELLDEVEEWAEKLRSNDEKS